MSLRTSFTELVGCPHPIQMAGMGSLARAPLAEAVSRAGALGMLGWSGAPPEYWIRQLERFHRSSDFPIGINFIVDGWTDPITGELDPECVAAVKALSPHVRVAEFFYAEPDPRLVEAAHSGGALAAWQVGSPDEATAAVRAGCDVVVAQGVEAGGHVRGKVGLFTLLAEILPWMKVPVVAAGGIGTGRQMAAALTAGAAAVRVGTRFVAAQESEAHPDYVQRLIRARASDTVVTETFSTNWPHAPHRVLRECVEAVREAPEGVIGSHVRPWDPNSPVPVHRGDCLVPLTTTTGRIDAMPHWAGESVGAVAKIAPASEIIEEMVADAERILQGRFA